MFNAVPFQMLNQKVKKLEHLLTLKDVKVEDLNIEIFNLKSSGKRDTSPFRSSPTLTRRSHGMRNSRDSDGNEGFLQPQWK